MSDDLYVVQSNATTPYSLVKLPEHPLLVPTTVVYTLRQRGTLSVGPVAEDFLNIAQDLTILTVAVRCGTGPTGARVEVDLKIGGTSILSTGSPDPLQVPDPLIPGGGWGSSTPTVWGPDDPMDAAYLGEGDVFSVEILQVGSTLPGADLSVSIWTIPKDNLAALLDQ